MVEHRIDIPMVCHMIWVAGAEGVAFVALTWPVTVASWMELNAVEPPMEVIAIFTADTAVGSCDAGVPEELCADARGAQAIPARNMTASAPCTRWREMHWTELLGNDS